MRLLQDMLSFIQIAETQEEAFTKFNNAMLDYGYDSNVYTLLTDHPSIGLKSTHGLAASYPRDWLDHYNAHKYQEVDPVWRRLLQSPTPFFWADVMDRINADSGVPEEKAKAALRIMNEAAEAGVSDGIGISYINSCGEMAAVALSRKNGERQRRYEDMADIFLLASFFHEKFRSFFERPVEYALTPREREVLLWASEGKTDSDIANILNVTSATVRFHWKNIFHKLDVSGRLPAVIKSFNLNIITPQHIRSSYQS